MEAGSNIRSYRETWRWFLIWATFFGQLTGNAAPVAESAVRKGISFASELSTQELGEHEIRAIDDQVNFQSLQRSGDYKLQYDTALRVEISDEIPQRYKSSRQLLEVSAQSSHGPALLRLALYFEHGIGGEKNHILAIKYCRQAMAIGEPSAFALLTKLVAPSSIPLMLSQKELAVITGRCESGEPAAMYLTAVMRLQDGEPNRTEGRNLMIRAAANGSPHALLDIAKSQSRSDDFPTDPNLGQIVAALRKFFGSGPDRDERIAEAVSEVRDKNTCEKLVRLLEELEDSGDVKAALIVARALETVSNGSAPALRAAKRHSNWALRLGYNGALLQEAILDFKLGDVPQAGALVVEGKEQHVWRCEYADMLIEGGIKLSDALEKARNSKYVDFAAASVRLRAIGETIPPIPLSRDFGEFDFLENYSSRDNGNMAVVSFLVNTDGRVTNVDIRDCSNELASKIRERVQKWHFAPAEKKGEKISMVIRIPIKRESQ